MEKQMLTPQEVADILKIKKTTVYEMIKRGDLPATRLGKQLRISSQALESYLDNTPASSIVLCGQDVVLDKICDWVNATSYDFQVLRSHMGSYNALCALYNGRVNIATAHLWDYETDTYNLPFITRLLPGMPVAGYHLLRRRQGFYVRKGNPRGIESFADFRRDDLLFINREKGCGTRILLDGKLLQLGIDPYAFPGYEHEIHSHLAGATAVAKGEADFALGCEQAAMQLPDLDFVPLQTEEYVMVIPLRYHNQSSYQQVIQTIQQPDFIRETALMDGYDTTDMGTRII